MMHNKYVFIRNLNICHNPCQYIWMLNCNKYLSQSVLTYTHDIWANFVHQWRPENVAESSRNWMSIFIPWLHIDTLSKGFEHFVYHWCTQRHIPCCTVNTHIILMHFITNHEIHINLRPHAWFKNIHQTR